MSNNESISSPTPIDGHGKASLPDGSIYEGDFKMAAGVESWATGGEQFWAT